VNAHGIVGDRLLIRSGDDDISSLIATNLTGSLYSCRAVLRSMLKRRYGRIVNIGSVVGTYGNVGQVAYSASKSGLVGASKSLAKEVADKGITVNVICPGFIDTPMTASAKVAGGCAERLYRERELEV